MSTNGVNTCEDSEMAECDGEKVVTMMDVLKEQEDFEEDANAVLGASDDKDCTYSKGYIKRQAIYACMTCCAEARDDPSKRAGVCLACSLNCHESHELIELYTKRNFRCDCGNPNFNSHPCQFTPNKTELNKDNVYNQNFSGVYCTCHRPYPDPECSTEQDMIQCVICEDWLHSSHLDAVAPPNEQYTEMICKACMDKNEFLHDYSDLTVNKENVDVDILNMSSENGVKCNGSSSVEMGGQNIIADTDCTDKSKNDDNLKAQINMEVESENVTEETKELEQPDAESKSIDEHKASSDDQSKLDATDETEGVNEKKDSLPANETSDEQVHSNIFEGTWDGISTQSSEVDEDSNAKQNSTENKHSTESELPVPEESSNETSNDVKGSLESTDEGTNNKIQDSIDIKTETDSLVDKESSDKKDQNNLETNSSQSDLPICEKTDNHILSKEEGETSMQVLENASLTNEENTTHVDELKTEQESSEQVEKTNDINEGSQSSDINQTSTHSDSTEKSDTRSQEQVEEDLLLADPMEGDQVHAKELHESESASTNENSNMNSEEPVVENKPEPQAMDTSECEENPENNKNLETESVPVMEKAKENSEDKTNCVNNKDKSDILVNENEDIKEQKTNEDKTILGADMLKRKLPSESDNDDSKTKKPKLNENQCVRPKGVKKIHQGATFWPSNFRHKLCTCSECLSMYKDLSVLFLIDPDDTVTAYERLGKEKTDGKPLSQYEKGMAALSSLGRVQQINALTEYTKMRDKLLEFLKSFKDRKVIVKEEDIKAFFAGMKPVREPDGVYFCR